VGGLLAALVFSVVFLPTAYTWFAGPSDHLPAPDEALED
jgi:hypothetical protein